jgi:hypothetical protein
MVEMGIEAESEPEIGIEDGAESEAGTDPETAEEE